MPTAPTHQAAIRAHVELDTLEMETHVQVEFISPLNFMNTGVHVKLIFTRGGIKMYRV